jgi:SAM-dependent methyltransferase
MAMRSNQADYRNLTAAEAQELPPGSRHYRAYVGTPHSYDIAGATQFMLMTALGLREWNTLLDIGCGSLSGGRLFIPYLNAGCYFGLEPNKWLVDDGIRFEVGEDLCRIKRPSFRFEPQFAMTKLGTQFDYMIAHSVLTHVPRVQLELCLHEASLSLTPSGIFAASFFSEGQEVYDGADWVYPGFTSYPVETVTAVAARHRLSCHPLIWSNVYGHYWMVFFHAAYASKLSWLGELNHEQRLLRILELSRAVAELTVKLQESEAKLKSSSDELALLRGKKSW